MPTPPAHVSAEMLREGAEHRTLQSPPTTHGVRHGSRRSLGEHKSHQVLENCTQVMRWVQSICRPLSRSCLSR